MVFTHALPRHSRKTSSCSVTLDGKPLGYPMPAQKSECLCKASCNHDFHLLIVPVLIGGSHISHTQFGNKFQNPLYFDISRASKCKTEICLHLKKRQPNISPIISNFKPQWDSSLNALRSFSKVPKPKSRMRIPQITISCAMTLDGKIAYSNGNLVLSDRLDWERTFRDRASADAVLVGASSAAIIQHRYGSYGFGMEPLKVILDPSLRTPPQARIFENSYTLIFHAPKALKSRINVFKVMRGVSLVKMPSSHFNPKKILAILARLGIKSVLIEGGGKTINGFVRAGCFDKIRVFISPQIISGDAKSTISIAQGMAFPRSCKLKLARVQKQGIGVLAEFKKAR